MAPERNENEGEDVVDNGVLATTDGTETTGIGIVEGVTAQVEVALPATFDDDDFDDDDVVQGEDVTLIEIAPVREAHDAPEPLPLAAE